MREGWWQVNGVWQIILHLVGDYIVQSDWMAQRKLRCFPVALVHGVTYAIPFLLIGSPLAVVIIALSHAVIDRYRLAKYLVWARNQLAPRRYRRPWGECSETGFHQSKPIWMATWLAIIADNTLHLIINALCIEFVR